MNVQRELIHVTVMPSALTLMAATTVCVILDSLGVVVVQVKSKQCYDIYIACSIIPLNLDI